MKAGDRHSWKAHRKMFYGVKNPGETAWAGPRGPSALPASVLKADTRQLPSQAIFKQRGFLCACNSCRGVKTSPEQSPPHHTDMRGSGCWGSLGRIPRQAPHGAAAARRAQRPDPWGLREGWGVKCEAGGTGDRQQHPAAIPVPAEGPGKLLVSEGPTAGPMSAALRTEAIYCMGWPLGKTAVYGSAALLEEQQLCLCCSDCCISRTCYMVFETLPHTAQACPRLLGPCPSARSKAMQSVARASAAWRWDTQLVRP